MSASAPASSPCNEDVASSVALIRSWMTVVSSMETLSQEMLDSSYPGSETYSAEDEEMFWTVVHQGYSAKFDDPDKAGDAQTLRHQWQIIRPSVAEFDAIVMEIWPDPAKHLDTLHPHNRKKVLHQLKVLYQDRTGQCFYHMKVWKLLVHHSKWRRVLRPLILRQQAGKATVPRKARNETVNCEEKAPISHEQLANASSTERVAVLKIRPDQTKQPIGKKKARNTTQTLGRSRTMESKDYSVSPTRTVPAVVPQKPEKTQLQDIKSSLNGDGDVAQRVSGVHLAMAWANICCSCVDMSPRLEESHDWFWFLVSSIYFDLAAVPDCRSDIEQVLREVLREMRAQIASFHSFYEKELAGMSTASHSDRESMVSRAMGGLFDAKWPLVQAPCGMGGVGVPQRLGNRLKATIT